MQHRAVLFVSTVLLAARALAGGDGYPARIVSLSPSTTETLFSLGLGDRVVGVTRFCNYPPEARGLRKVGGYLDPNYEAIAALEPDLVFLLPEQERVLGFLDELGIRHVTVNNKTVPEILDAALTIGRECGVGEEARAMVAGIEARIARIDSMTRELPRPRVLVVVERTVEGGELREAYVAGPSTHYDELLRGAGGVNAYEGGIAGYPMLTAEGIIHCRPDIIIDIRPLAGAEGEREAAMREWGTLPGIDAVRSGRVFVLAQDYAVVPGPRFIELLEEMARLVHPEVPWGDR